MKPSKRNMILNKPLIDTNVCLDNILDRKPFAAHALELTQRSQQGSFDGIIAAHSFDTLFYLLNKRIGKTKAYKGIKALRKAYGIAPVMEQVIDKAINANWKDFEDAIHYYSAKAAGCDAIVTRNEKDFKQSDLPVLSPGEFLARFSTDEEE